MPTNRSTILRLDVPVSERERRAHGISSALGSLVITAGEPSDCVAALAPLLFRCLACAGTALGVATIGTFGRSITWPKEFNPTVVEADKESITIFELPPPAEILLRTECEILVVLCGSPAALTEAVTSRTPSTRSRRN